MQENTNKAIAYNSIMLYCSLAITSVCGLFNTRYSLMALGVDDFGLFSVLGGIIAMIDVVNTIMVSTTTRFMAYAIGKGGPIAINKQFNINRNLHISVAILTLLIAFPIGYWYIHTHINYEGDISNAMMVFSISLVASVITFLAVPYNGLMRAKENFLTPSLISVVSAITKLIFVILLCHFFTRKLFLYALFTGIITAYPTLVNIIYCRKHYIGVTDYHKVGGLKEYKEVFKYSIWAGYGSVACVFKAQGAGIIINAFFNTAMNAALGVANTVNNLIITFARNTYLPMLPQITKSYAAQNTDRCMELVNMTTKFSYLIILVVSSPFLIAPEWILGIWLKEVPPYAVSFMTLLIIDSLVGAFNQGISTLIQASGKIVVYEFVGNTLRLIALVVAFFFLKSGTPPESLLVIYIICTILIVILNQIIVHYQVNFNNKEIFLHSYLPSIIVTILFVPFLFLQIDLHSVLVMLLGLMYLFTLIFLIGFKKSERQYIKQIFKTIKTKFKKTGTHLYYS